MTFNDLVFKEHGNWGAAGQHAVVFFPNGYGASVITGLHSYGGKDGLYELAVLEGTEGDSWICYNTPITDDVEGYLTPSDVTRLLQEIEKLPANAPDAS